MEPAKEIKIEPVSTEGMEQIFEEVPTSELVQEKEQFPAQEQEEEEQPSETVKAVELVPASIAAEKFGKTRRYISKLANEGRIRAEKNENNQWIVELESVQEFFQGTGTKEERVPATENKGTSSVRSLLEQERIKELEKKNKELEQEVRNSHFRLGYFESEMFHRNEQIKLLEDRQAEASKDSELLKEVQKSFSDLEDDHFELEAKNKALLEEVEHYKSLVNRSGWKKLCDWLIGASPKQS